MADGYGPPVVPEVEPGPRPLDPGPWAPPPAASVRADSPVLHLLLFLLTVVTTVIAGAYLDGVDPFEPGAIWRGLPFAASLLFILGIHESAHYLASRRYGLKVTLPYFIPAPPPYMLIGTLGAIIKIRSPIPNRRALLDIGAAGPLAGFLASLPIAVIGLGLSQVKPTTALPPGGEGIGLGSSLLFGLLEHLFAPAVTGDAQLVLHPVAFAGWVGLWVTALNLLPVGQLDGGHVMCALFGGAHRFVSLAVLAVLVPLGFLWPGWLLWAVLLGVMGWRHPPPLDPYAPLNRRHKVTGFLAMAVFVVTFIPAPFALF